MNERKAWTKEEDQLLLQIMQQQDSEMVHRKMKWDEIAEKISKLSAGNVRKGKQCRERWFNQLHPSISKEVVWAPDQEKTLFELHEQFGNHWAKISKFLPGRSDNNIKNYFYCSLRKALRKVNSFLSYNRRHPAFKNIKPFQTSTLTKILAVIQKKTEKKLHILKDEAFNLAKQIKNMLLQIQVFQNYQTHEQNAQYFFSIIEKIQTFNRICKRKKIKRKVTKTIPIGRNMAELTSMEEEGLSESERGSEAAQKGQANANSNSFSQLQQPDELKNQQIQQIPTNNKPFGLKFHSSESFGQSEKIHQEEINHSNLSLKQAIIQAQKSQNINQSLQAKQNNVFQKVLSQSATKPLLPIIPIAQPAFYYGSGFIPTILSSSQMFRLSHSSFFQSINPFNIVARLTQQSQAPEDNVLSSQNCASRSKKKRQKTDSQKRK